MSDIETTTRGFTGRKFSSQTSSSEQMETDIKKLSFMVDTNKMPKCKDV